MQVKNLDFTRLVPWLASGERPFRVDASSKGDAKRGILRSAIFRTFLAALLVVAGPMREAFALSLIRDAEIEHIIRDFSEPVFVAAGLNPNAVKTYLVKDDSINAFVSGGQKVFIFTGLIEETEEPGQLIGVIAHETGHITGGHLSRSQEAVSTAAAPAVLGLLLGIGAIAAGAGDAGMALISGGQHLAQRTILSYSRTQEASADQAAAKFLERSGQSGKGLVSFFDKLADQEALTSASQDPYVRSHPLSRERISSLQSTVEASPFYDKTYPEDWQFRLDMAKAKLHGYIDPPRVTFRLYKESDQSLPARYARALAYYKMPDTEKSLQLTDALIAEQPENPYFYELKGQTLFEAGRAVEAVAPYRRSTELQPDEPLLMIGLAHALLATQSPADATEARQILERATQIETDYPEAYRLLAEAYAAEGNEPMAALATAERYYARGDNKEAKQWAERAQRDLKPGTPEWRQAEDIAQAQDPNL